MHDPERASAAESREFQSRCRMPLGDIACHVHAAEKERRSAFSWPLQCRQAVAGLFETHQKILAKPVDVMAQAPRGPSEPIIRHQRSEEHTSELQSLMRTSYAVICLKKKIKTQTSP